MITTIKLQLKDIEQGFVCDSTNCALTQAINRSLKDGYCSRIGISTWRVGREEGLAFVELAGGSLPAAAYCIRDAFDHEQINEHNINNFDPFELDIPTELLR